MKIESRAQISIGEQALANGQTALTFQEAGLSDPQGEPVPVGALMGAAVSVGVSAMYLPLVLR